MSATPDFSVLLRGRESLAAYYLAVAPRYEIARHIQVIINHLEALERGDFLNLMIFIPPRYGKSELATAAFPSWYLGRHPENHVMMAAYAGELIEDFSQKARNYMQSDYHCAIFPECRIDERWNAKHDYRTTLGGALRAVGRGGAATGRGADLYLVDDCIKDRKEAESPAIQKELRDWFTDVVLTRRHPQARLCIINCVAQGERIPLADGRWVAIETIKAGDVVWSYDNGEIRPSRVLDRRLSGVDKVLRISTGRCTIRVNARHPILAIPAVRTKAGKRPGLLLPNNTKLKPRWIVADELAVGDVVVNLRAFPEHHSTAAPVTFVDRSIDADFMWWFGFLFGDGWVTKYKKRTRNRGGKITPYERDCYALCIALSVYPELNLKVLEAARRWTQTSFYKTRYGYIRTDSIRAGRELQQLGLIGRATQKRVPEWVFGVNKEFKRAFIRGFIDADGCKSKKGIGYTVGIANQDLLEDLRLLAMESGIRTGRLCVYHPKRQPPHSKELIEREIAFAQFFDDDADPRGVSLSPDGVAHETVRFERIKEITQDGESEVYDLAVEGESFVAEGFITHNTRWSPADLCGWELEKKTRMKWTILELPAMGRWMPQGYRDREGRIVLRVADEQDGDALWPERFPKEYLEEMRDELSRDSWLALYQQRPTFAGDEQIFDPNWFQTIDMQKDRINTREMFGHIIADPASKKKKGSDYTVMWVIGMATDRNYYFVDGICDKLGLSERWEALVKLHKKWNQSFKSLKVWWESFGKDSEIEYFTERMKTSGYRFAIDRIGSTAIGKEDLIRDFGTGFCKDRRVFFNGYIPVVTDGKATNLARDMLEIEWARYPAVKHDDRLNAAAYITKIGQNFPKDSNRSSMEAMYEARRKRYKGVTPFGA